MKVSIIIPYNIDRGWLSRAVAAAEKQEGFQLNKDYEIIVQHGDGQVGENINKALAKAKGKYIKICAEDDEIAPGCLFALYHFAVKGGYDLVCADAYSFEGDRQIVDKVCSEIPHYVKDLAEHNTIHGGTILYRRGAMPQWNESLWTGEEFEISLRMAAAGCKFGKLNEVVFWYRVHPGQKSLKHGEEHLKRKRYIRDVIAFDYSNNKTVISR